VGYRRGSRHCRPPRRAVEAAEEAMSLLAEPARGFIRRAGTALKLNLTWPRPPLVLPRLSASLASSSSSPALLCLLSGSSAPARSSSGGQLTGPRSCARGQASASPSACSWSTPQLLGHGARTACEGRCGTLVVAIRNAQDPGRPRKAVPAVKRVERAEQERHRGRRPQRGAGASPTMAKVVDVDQSRRSPLPVHPVDGRRVA
jgi:hypothetical protein